MAPEEATVNHISWCNTYEQVLVCFDAWLFLVNTLNVGVRF